MHKLIVTLSSSNHPLEERILENPVSQEFLVEDIHNTEEILRKAEDFVRSVKSGHEDAIINMEVATESGNIVLSGYINDGFHGVSTS